MKRKYAKDLKINDKFFHNELHSWQVMSAIEKTSNETVTVKCCATNKVKLKTFEFGRLVRLDLD
jgi:hypothetical protein